MSKEQDKRNKEMIRNLFSGREDVVLSTLRDIRHEGNQVVLRQVIRLVFTGTSPVVEEACINLLNDLKEQSSVDTITGEIEENRGNEKMNMVVSACWQNGLDFSNHLDLFIDLAIEEDYLTCIEAFSVVEGNIHNLNFQEREDKAFYIEKNLSRAGIDKHPLLREMIEVVRPVPGPFRIDTGDGEE